MLLFVKKQYSDQIKTGKKNFEIRAGERFRNIKLGHIFSINGHFKVRVTKIQKLNKLPKNDCYATGTQGPFFKFHIRMA